MPGRLRLAYMGTPDFAVPALRALISAGHDIACVYSQPPRPAGRGQKERLSPVHAFADAAGIPVRSPKTLRDAAEQEAFAALDLDAAVVAAYGLILPKPVLDAPRLGCFNIHASLLPRWRGAAPIHRAILAGDTGSGVTIMRMDEGLDTGDMIFSQAVPIDDTTTAEALHDRLAELGAELIVTALADVAAGTAVAVPQPKDGVTYAAKLSRDEGQLDWSRTAIELSRAVRAYTPWPGAWFDHGDTRIKVLAAEAVTAGGAPGTILDDRLTVACGEGALRLLRVQRSGKGPIDADSFLRGYNLPRGTVLP
jgi:methionyl-tRNA formyltransferase